jgi:hypothetical protein
MLRERAQFSAGVTSARILQSIQDRVSGQVGMRREQLANGKTATFDRSSFIDSIRQIGRDEGLEPAEESKRGGLEDITSIPRLGMIYDMQNNMATGYAQYKLDQNEGALALWPAQRLTPSTARVPRATWAERWREAGEQVGWEGAIKGDFLALKTSPIWAALSRFGTPWPPFDFGSTRELEDVERDEAVKVGLLKENEVLKPGVPDFNANLQASVTGLSAQFRDILKAHFGDQISLDEDTIKWNIEDTDYEGEREEQRGVAKDALPKLGRVFSAMRSGDWGAPISDAILRDRETVQAVEV